MDSNTGQNQSLIRTISRKSFEEYERVYGSDIARAVWQSSLPTGMKTLNRIYLQRWSKTIREYLSIDGDLYYDLHYNTLFKTTIEYNHNVGCLEQVSNVMRTEIGVMGTHVGFEARYVSYEIDDFLEAMREYIFTPGKQIVIKGIVGSGKTDLGCLLGEHNIKRGHIFASNIPMENKDGEIYDHIFRVDSLSELMKLRLKIPINKHIIMAIDEPESVFQNLLKITKEGKNIGVFFHLIRKYNMSIISIWHFEKDIPDYLKTQIEENGGIYINKQDKKTAFYDTSKEKGMIVRIPQTSLNFISAGHGSAATFFIDLDIKNLLRKTSGDHPPAKAKKLLEEALNHKSVYLKEYQDDVVEEKKAEDIQAYVKIVLNDKKKYLTHTGRTFDWRLIKRLFNITENTAKDIKNEAMRQLKDGG